MIFEELKKDLDFYNKLKKKQNSKIYGKKEEEILIISFLIIKKI